MSAALVSVAVDPTMHRLLLVVAAVLIGASVGLVVALVVGFAKAARAKRPPAAAVRMPVPPLPRMSPEPLAEPVVAAPAPSPFVAPAISAVPALYAVDGDVARDRHRDLYDEEYVKQLHHVDALRRTIGTRLALAGEPHQPQEAPDPAEELDP